MTRAKGYTPSPASIADFSDAGALGDYLSPAVVHAFADERFKGNPAAVVLCERYPTPAACVWLAQRFHQPVTAFVRPHGKVDHFEIRWFTQNAELDLCGHGTLAATHWLFAGGHIQSDRICYHAKRGRLNAWRQEDSVQVELPAIATTPANPLERQSVQQRLRLAAKEVRKAYDDYVVVVAHEATVLDYQPDFQAIAEIECRGVVLTAAVDPTGPLREFDIVSRFFSPRIAIDEDQVCVSAHCKLYPYWSEGLRRGRLRALQASSNGGVLELSSLGDRVVVGGRAKVGRIEAVASRELHRSMAVRRTASA